MVLLTPALETADPAPALTRGLALLRRLSTDGSASLEQLAEESGWPKSSVARLLTSLTAAGAVERDVATRHYSARVRLVSIDAREEAWISRWRPLAAILAEQAGHTAELFSWAGGRLTMIDRCEPAGAMVSAKARIGFQRELSEFDALTQVAVAFGGTAVSRFWAWQGGVKSPVSAALRRQRIDRLLNEGSGCDLGVNSNGICRYAAPVLGTEPGSDRRLLAVVAIAQVCILDQQPGNADLLRLVASAGQTLSGLVTAAPMSTRAEG